MLPPLADVETFCLTLPTFRGIGAILHNGLDIMDWSAANHRTIFVISGIVLWAYPTVFTWPFWPFKFGYGLILYILGFEKGAVRRDSYASRYQSEHYGGYIPEYSTFSRLQAAGYMGDQETDEAEGAQSKVPIYTRMLGWMAGILAVRAIFM